MSTNSTSIRSTKNWRRDPEFGVVIDTDGDRWRHINGALHIRWCDQDVWNFWSSESALTNIANRAIAELWSASEIAPVEPQAPNESTKQAPERTAPSFLNAALGHMVDRAKTYDKPQGERSMGNCVRAFNTITGHALTEEQGWLFMALLKIVRTQQGKFKPDNYEDLAAYAGLAGESAAKSRT